MYLLSAEYSVVMCGAWPGTLVAWLWLRFDMIYSFALRLWSQIFVMCMSCLLPDLVAMSCSVVPWQKNKKLSVVAAKCWVLGFVVWDRTFICSDLTATLHRCLDLWLFTNINGCRVLSCLLLILVAIVWTGWVLRPRIIMVLLPVTSQLRLVAISWLSARPMHVVEHLNNLLMTAVFLI